MPLRIRKLLCSRRLSISVALCLLLAAGTALAAAVEGAYRPLVVVPSQLKSTPAGGLAQADILRVPASAWIALAAPAADEMADLRPRQIGIARSLADAAAPILAWQRLKDGSQVAAIGIESAHALGLRVGLELINLPDTAELWFSTAQQSDDAIRVNGGAALEAATRSQLYWSPTLYADALLLHVRLPAGFASDAVVVRPKQLSHLFHAPQPARRVFPGDSNSCEVDASCYPRPQSDAVAHIQFVENGLSYVCSGTLLNDLDASSWRPFFLTARHCVADAAVAATVESYWFYETESCNGVQKTPLQLSSGATFLFSSADTDMTLLELRDTPPAGALYAGWSEQDLAGSEAVFGIHHPQGDLKKISFGDGNGFSSCVRMQDFFDCHDSADGDYFKVRWSLGTTEGGSSGSGLFLDDSGMLVGVLSHGPSGVCTVDDEYGLFSRGYSDGLHAWLAPPEVPETVSAPEFDPAGGTYSASQMVTLSSATDAAAIRYSDDGSTPTCSSGSLLANGGQVSVSESLTLRAIACKTGWNDSAVTSASYVISGGQVAPPAFSPGGGTYDLEQNVTVRSATDGALIGYRIDGSFPDCASSTLISNGATVAVTQSLILRAVACKSGWQDSALVSASYTLTGQVAPPDFTPPGGAYGSAQEVVLRTGTQQANIRYTTDGTTPSCASGTALANGGAVRVEQPLTLKAVGCREGWQASSVATASYSLGGGSQLSNISTRGQVDSGAGVMVGGFVISGSQSKQVLIRGIGPSLSAAGISGALYDPALALYAANGQLISENDDWQEAEQAEQIAALPWTPSDSLEAAILATLEPGAYTAQLSGFQGASGIGMVEVYAVDTTDSTATLINISTRAQINTGVGVMVGGFVVEGASARQVLIRGIGPSLAAAGVPGVLDDPLLTLYSAAGAVMESNDDWGDSARADDIAALPWPPASEYESAILISLPPGAYTAHVAGWDGSTGIGMVEVYVAQ